MMSGAPRPPRHRRSHDAAGAQARLNSRAYDANVDPARRRQFDHLGTAKRELLAWAVANDVPLVRVEFVVPFVPTGFDAAVWLFFDTDANVARCADNGVTARLEQEFRTILARSGYPADWLAGTSFYVDSHDLSFAVWRGWSFARAVVVWRQCWVFGPA
jgi:hypothetical protein